MTGVLHIVTRDERRGAENAARYLSAEMRRRGVGSRVLALAPGYSHERTSDVQPLVAHEHAGRPVAWTLAAARLRRHLADSPGGVVLAHGGEAAAVAAAALVGRRVPLVWQRILEYPDGFVDSLRSVPWRLLLRKVDAVVALTGKVEWEIRAMGFHGPVSRIPNHRPWELFGLPDRTPARDLLRRELGISDRLPVVGFVGHLVPQKRPDRFVELASLLSEGGPDARFVMVGGGRLHDAVLRDVETRGLADRVTILGHRSDIPSVLAGLDVLVLTSETESMTGVAIEAQMAGCPVVSFALDGIDEVVEDGVTGSLVQDRRVESLASATSSLLTDEALLQTMSRAAPACARQFSTEVVADRYLRVLYDVLDRNRATALR